MNCLIRLINSLQIKSKKNNVTIYYQVYSDTFYKEMFEKVRGKQEIIDNIIVSENEK
jgi:hypothetical protein